MRRGVSFKSHSIKAVSISPFAIRLISEHDMAGWVYGVFERGFNVVTHNGRLIGVMRKDVPHGPINIIIDLPSNVTIPSLGLENGMKVVKIGNSLSIGNGSVNILLENAGVWNPRILIDRKNVRIPIIRRNIDMIMQLSKAFSDRKGLGQLIGDVKKIISGDAIADQHLNSHAKYALPFIRELMDAVKALNLNKIDEKIDNLIGFCLGLTPSTDDMLMGFMAVLVMAANYLDINKDYVMKVNRHIISNVKGKTSLISNELLEQAAVGNVAEPVRDLIGTMFATKAANKGIIENVKKTVEIGETSGTDTLLGILLGFELVNTILEREEWLLEAK